MSRRGDAFLGKAKVNKLFLLSMLDAVQYIVMMATDRIIVGRMLGSDAVAGVVTISPVFELSSVFESLITTGTVILYTRAVADYDEKKRRSVFGMAITIAIVLGVIMFAAAFLLEDFFLNASGVTGIVREYAGGYFFYYRFTFLIRPLLFLLEELLYVEGDEVRPVASSLSMLFGNAVLSYLLIPYMGILGASLGSAAGMVIAFLIVLSYYVSKEHRINPIFSFDSGETREMIMIGVTDSANNLFDCVYAFLINMFITRMFGGEYLVVIAVAELVYEMMLIGGGVGDAMKTMLISYRGDRNGGAMKSLFKYSLKITLVLGVIFIGVVWIAAPGLPVLFGIKGSEMIRLTTWACRLTSLSVIAVIVNELFLDYYINIGKYMLNIVGHFFDSFFIRFVSNVMFAFGFGVYGIWAGEAVCTYISVAIMAAVIIALYGRDQFPFLLESSSGNSINMSYRAVMDEIMDARDRTEAFLKEKKVPRRAVNLSMVFIEDMSVMIHDANSGEKDVNIDVFITCNPESLQLVLWSDGKNMNLADADAVPENLRTFLITSLIEGFDESKYQQTAGYNRASFIIPYRRLAVNTNRTEKK